MDVKQTACDRLLNSRVEIKMKVGTPNPFMRPHLTCCTASFRIEL